MQAGMCLEPCCGQLDGSTKIALRLGRYRILTEYRREVAASAIVFLQAERFTAFRCVRASKLRSVRDLVAVAIFLYEHFFIVVGNVAYVRNRCVACRSAGRHRSGTGTSHGAHHRVLSSQQNDSSATPVSTPACCEVPL
ncbi:hypothetical protein EVAR_64456_1 [Eumeta japonica]|uniref:Uncharacterized protein n=1 Tax=Eumeta variegata TaxID=151549 RepID=A0A4C1ZKK2_EUMVA|nr:hypothetical protein EVAR_64456_1 [Eumeta japonica]